MANLTIEEVIGIADEVIPMWREGKHDSRCIYARYLLSTECYKIQSSYRVIGSAMGFSYGTIWDYLTKYSPVCYDDIHDAFYEGLRNAKMDKLGIFCDADSYGELLAKPLMDELNAKECRIDYVNGKIRVRYVEQAED